MVKHNFIFPAGVTVQIFSARLLQLKNMVVNQVKRYTIISN